MAEENMEDLSFSGFMQMINQVFVTQESTMLDTEGGLINAHSIKINTKDGSEYVFSILNHDLMRLAFLIFKVVNSE